MSLLLVLFVLIGGLLGLLGGGASILTVPMLVYAAGLSGREAIATSLVVVGVTSFAALLNHAYRGRVAWRVGWLFGIASMIGAYGGGRIARFLSAQCLLFGFTCVMLVTSLAMLRSASDVSEPARHRKKAPLAQAGLIGVSIGLLTGTIGAGGGFLIVPALTLIGGLPIRIAIGTSLLVITMNSCAGVASTLKYTVIPWPVAIAAAGACVAGSWLGAPLAGRIQPARLRKGFAWFVLAAALSMAARQIAGSNLPSGPVRAATSNASNAAKLCHAAPR